MNKLTPSQVVDEWIKAKCELRGHDTAKRLYASYKAFTEEHGYPSLSKQAIAFRLSYLGLPPYITNGHTSLRAGLSCVA